jgi:hypothetical protein
LYTVCGDGSQRRFDNFSQTLKRSHRLLIKSCSCPKSAPRASRKFTLTPLRATCNRVIVLLAIATVLDLLVEV